MDRKQQAFELLGNIAGGGIAGLLDVEMSQTMPLGLPVGAVAGIGLCAVGFFVKGKIGEHAMNLGSGALSFEAGTAVVNRVLASKAAATTAPAAVAGMFGPAPQRPAINASRPLTDSALRSHLRAMAEAA